MSARANILGKLRNSLAGTTPRPDEFDERLVTAPWRYAPEDRIDRLRSLMEAVHTEVHPCRSDNWPELVAELLNKRNLTNLLCAPSREHGRALQAYFEATEQKVELLAYDQPVEDWKEELFKKNK